MNLNVWDVHDHTIDSRPSLEGQPDTPRHIMKTQRYQLCLEDWYEVSSNAQSYRSAEDKPKLY